MKGQNNTQTSSEIPQYTDLMRTIKYSSQHTEKAFSTYEFSAYEQIS